MSNVSKINSIQTKNTVTFMQINISGLSTLSSTGLDKYANDLKADVVAVAETKKDIPVLLKNYDTPFISSTLQSGGKVRSGGTALYITEKATGTAQIKQLEGKEFSSVWILCIIQNSTYLIASVYVPHNSPSATKEFLKAVEKANEFCKHNKVKYMKILGDFNARHTAWSNTISNKQGNILAEFINENDDTFIASPGTDTFICKGGGSTIDISLCNRLTLDSLIIHVVDEVYHLGSGAPSRGLLPVISVLKTKGEWKRTNTKSVPDFKRTDWDAWITAIENICYEQLAELQNANTAEALWHKLGNMITEVNDNIIPRKTVCPYSKPFWNDELTTASLKIKYAARLFQRNNSYINSALVANAKQEYSDMLTQSINKWMQEKAGELNNSKMITFWKKYKKYLCGAHKKSKVEIIKRNNEFILTEEGKVKVFQDTFFSGKHLEGCAFNEQFFNKVNEEIDQKLQTEVTECGEDLLNKPFEMYELDLALKKITTNDKSPDNDYFHPIMLTKAGKGFKAQLLRVANMILEEGNWIWNESKVIFIKKEGKKSYAEAGSYRPLSINSYIGKLVERLIEKRLRDHLIKNKILDEEQEGFQPGMSTTRYLYRLISQMKRFKQKKMVEICLLIDFEKAFDSVWIKGLLYKLNTAGVTGKVWALLANMLLKRTVKLQINEYLSHKILCMVGIPQGSVLAPLLFIFFISDMPVTLNTERFKYADDQSVLTVSTSAYTAHANIQLYCDMLYEWCCKWRIKINCNKGKTEAVVVNAKKEDIPQLKIGGNVIEYVKESPVLGVIIDEDVTFKAHAERMKGRALQRWWLVRRWCNRNRGLSLSTITTLIKAIILPTILYAAPAWCHDIPNAYNTLWYDLLKTACGAISKVDLRALELVAGLPPIDIQLETINIKFMIKNYCLREDILKTEMLVADSDIGGNFTKSHIDSLKRFIAHKQGVASQRAIELNELPVNTLKYNKKSINNYQAKLWNSRLVNSQEPINNSRLKPPPVEQFKAVKLSTRRSHETLILSMLHGHTVLNQFRYDRSQVPSPLCPYCGTEEETEHHLLFCPTTTHKQSFKHLNAYCTEKGLELNFTSILNSRIDEPIQKLCKYMEDIVELKPDLVRRKIFMVSREKKCEKCGKTVEKGKRRHNDNGILICMECKQSNRTN